MILKYGLTGSIILLCACSTTSMPASKRLFLDYEQPKSNAKSYQCMKNCNDLARSCEHYDMHGDAILSESINKNKCINDESTCLKKCGIDVKVIEKKVDIFGFSINEVDNNNYEQPTNTYTTKSEEKSNVMASSHNNENKLEEKSNKEDKIEQRTKSSRWNILKNYKRSQSFENF